MMDSITGSHHQMIMNKTQKILARPHLLEARANKEDDELAINLATNGTVRVIIFTKLILLILLLLILSLLCRMENNTIQWLS